MKYEIIQTKPYPTAEFEIQSKAGNVGKVAKIHKTKKWTDWVFEIEFQQKHYKMVLGEADHSLKAFVKDLLLPTLPKSNPYQLYENGIWVGEIFQRWGHRYLELNSYKYSTYDVGFGPAGQKCLVFEGWFDRRDNPGGKQIALIDTMNLGKLLARYEVAAEGDMAGIVALFLGLHQDNFSVHQNGDYPKRLYLKSWGTALQLYDPSFKDSVSD